MIDPTSPRRDADGTRAGTADLGLSRREWLAGVVAMPLAAALQQPVPAPLPRLDQIRKAPYRLVPTSPGMDARLLARVALEREWTGNRCRSRVTNRSGAPVALAGIVLFGLDLALPESTHLYGEGFQMLSQTGGTLGAPKDLGSYTDVKHYKLPSPEDTRSFYGLLTLSPPGGAAWALAFTSCRRFSGAFRLRPPAGLEVIVDTEGLTLPAGESWELEEFWIASGRDSGALLSAAAARVGENHPRLVSAAPPTGWCSWYCFGPRVTAKQVLDNLDAISTKIPGLAYVQIDDGYQPAMGDWLETGAAFGGDVRRVLDDIRKRGFQPAIWVAPFVAEAASHVFQQHPGWFVKNADGAPLRSDTVTFGGWRHGPWYVLDGTHPEVQAHFERVFDTMRREWGCTYFKLDANFWGAIHGGRFHDPRATRIEAYRRGMAAIRRGAGDSFILGCNHPLWPSLGLVHGSRSSNDITRTWDRVRATARQNLLRNWQNGRLWWNDPDAIVLSGNDLTDDEFQFHASAVYATGGMLLSGDDLTTLPEHRLAILKKLVPPTGVPAVFEDDSLRAGTIALAGRLTVCAFNWEDTPATVSAALPRVSDVVDFWTGEPVARAVSRVTLEKMPPHSARLLVCRNA